MNLLEVMDTLPEGAFVRREAWPLKRVAQLVVLPGEEDLSLVTSADDPLSQEDCLADDWVAVERWRRLGSLH